MRQDQILAAAADLLPEDVQNQVELFFLLSPALSASLKPKELMKFTIQITGMLHLSPEHNTLVQLPPVINVTLLQVAG
jgi:hypothetical protein